MFESFYPDEYYDSAYLIDYESYYLKGYRGIIFDIDNTLVPHGAPADAQAKGLFSYIGSLGFKCCLLSNNQKDRVDMFNRDINVCCVEDAHKPSVKGYEKAMEYMGTTRSDTLFVGDQLFTDIYGARRACIYSILVGQIDSSEEIQIVFKRHLEKIVLYFYKRKKSKKQV